ncbi:hypothetical protein N8Z48_02070 [Algibacter sp.]|nr:hypothetical protein [Algibacter sp.]
MRKIIFFILIVSTIITSCSSSDDSNNSSNDPILGTWGNYKDTYIDNGVEVIDEAFNPYYEVATFNADGTASTEINQSGSPIDATWKNVGNSRYQIKILGFTETFSVEFICNGNVMKWDEDGDGYIYYETLGFDNDTCDED